MTISIDGKVHGATLQIKYGEPFPRVYSNREIVSTDYGDCKVYITDVGIPEWSNRFIVKVFIKFYITEITEPSEYYLKEKRRKKTGLKLIEG
ncbi:hypothetical protein MKZ26_03390 [Sporosarcina sp. FSL K6-6792]|uniref:hypothetical protein n=1 Tax=Sporosarcina sp. FSL K6-6792 TaxID=2921559 RepID=UPI0030F834FB